MRIVNEYVLVRIRILSVRSSMKNETFFCSSSELISYSEHDDFSVLGIEIPERYNQKKKKKNPIWNK